MFQNIVKLKKNEVRVYERDKIESRSEDSKMGVPGVTFS